MSHENRMVPAGAFNAILSEIAAERERQIAKGHTPETDDGLPALDLRHKARNRLTHKANRQELIEAAALLVAEIQRIDRARLLQDS
jgi:hypothetical protein